MWFPSDVFVCNDISPEKERERERGVLLSRVRDYRGVDALIVFIAIALDAIVIVG